MRVYENRRQYRDTNNTNDFYFSRAKDIGRFYLDGVPVYHRTVLKKPVPRRARKRSYRGRDVKLISLKYRGREGFAVITGCSVNTRIKCARCNADRQVGKRSGAIVPCTRFSKLAVVTSPCSLPLPDLFSPSFSRSRSFFLFDPFRGLATEEKVIFERRNFYEPTAESRAWCVFKSAVHK